MSSEREFADGLTKESARLLLAQRLRHGRLKLVWDPTYKAAKKKTKEELLQSRMESVHDHVQVPASPTAVNEWSELSGADYKSAKMEIEMDEPVSWYEQATPNVLMAKTNDQLTYVFRRSCHVDRCRKKVYICRLKNVICWLWLIFLVPQLAYGIEFGMEKKEDANVLGIALCALFCMVLSSVFLLGRWSKRESSLHR